MTKFYLPVCLSISLPIYPLSVCPSVLSVYPSVHLFVCLPICPSVFYQCVCLPICLLISVCLSICLSFCVCLSTCLSVHSSTCPSICLFVCVFIPLVIVVSIPHFDNSVFLLFCDPSVSPDMSILLVVDSVLYDCLLGVVVYRLSASC